MKVLFVRVQPTNEMFHSFDGDVLVLGLNEASSGIKALADEARKVGKRLRSDATVSVIDCPTIVSTTAVEEHVKSFKNCERILKAIDACEPLVIEVPVAQVLAMEEEGESVECAQIHADLRNVWWDFYPKHTDMLYASMRVPVETFNPKST